MLLDGKIIRVQKRERVKLDRGPASRFLARLKWLTDVPKWFSEQVAEAGSENWVLGMRIVSGSVKPILGLYRDYRAYIGYMLYIGIGPKP